ncbi:lipopolysaccharide biosynthesis protein [Salegentibacter sediminis]|uniref:lipopolysaccharide biosynthesis protein n=1 Tax=Salegentibacter sediminis TaxID=1930251 RepID=UPI001E460C6F|nr:lipopolysaccharide biosynthesis protein [Salegentibacter sediminis]
MVWTFAQQFGNQIIGFIISMVLARLLMPEEFGLIGMIAVFVSVGKVLVDSGLTQSLIRTKDPDQGDFSTVFYFNLVTSILIYGIIYFSAPLIASFYEQNILTNIIRLYCIIFIIDAFSTVQRTRMTKRLDFKTQTIVSIPSTILGGVVGLSMAYSGYGVWSLVWSNISSSFLSSIQFWIYSKWTPDLKFSAQKFKDHFNFGYKLMFSSLLEKVFSNIYLIVIGKYFSAGQVGFYTRAETMKQLPVRNISSALGKVTYPLFASIQDDNVRLKRVYKQLMQIVVFVIAPTLIFLAILAEPIFVFLFTEKWLPAVPFFQILCITGILYPIHSYNLNVLKVKGRSDLVLKLSVYKKILTVIGIVIGIQFGIFGLLYAQIILSFLVFFINAYYTEKFINYPAFEQIKDIVPIILLALIGGAAVYGLDQFIIDQTNFIRITLGILLGTLTYLVFSYLIKLDGLVKLVELIRKRN